MAELQLLERKQQPAAPSRFRRLCGALGLAAALLAGCGGGEVAEEAETPGDYKPPTHVMVPAYDRPFTTDPAHAVAEFPLSEDNRRYPIVFDCQILKDPDGDGPLPDTYYQTSGYEDGRPLTGRNGQPVASAYVPREFKLDGKKYHIKFTSGFYPDLCDVQPSITTAT